VSKTQIVINSREALERLIGGDTELEVSLRQSVAEDFAKRYLKGLVNTDLMQRAKAEVEATLQMLRNLVVDESRVALQAFVTIAGWGGKWVLADSVKQSIREEAKQRVADEVHKAIAEAVEAKLANLNVIIDDEILRKVRYEVREEVKQALKKNLGE
jgi:phenylpyruvate tautomerase PptA (4-oxalocrotonate tautomerase family)